MEICRLFYAYRQAKLLRAVRVRRLPQRAGRAPWQACLRLAAARKKGATEAAAPVHAAAHARSRLLRQRAG